MMPEASPEERYHEQPELERRMAAGEVSIGAAVREIRQRFLGLTLEEYASMCGISKNTLRGIELDDEAATLKSLFKALSPLGYRLALVETPDA